VFTREKQIWIQVLALFFQIVSPAIPIIPDEWRPFFIALVSFLQAALAIFGQSKNPDGTPATVAYRKPE